MTGQSGMYYCVYWSGVGMMDLFFFLRSFFFVLSFVVVLFLVVSFLFVLFVAPFCGVGMYIT